MQFEVIAKEWFWVEGGDEVKTTMYTAKGVIDVE